jgi:AcrR family transcriptional regulator
MILEAAAGLFAERGFTGTGIDEIGAAVGVTGPAFYRHFESKHDLLVALIERAALRLQGVLDRALAEAEGRPEDALRVLARCSADACVDDGPLVALYTQEVRNLHPDARARLGGMRRRVRDEWVKALRQLRPDASDADLVFAADCVMALQISVASYRGELGPEEQKDLLTRLSLAALRWE